MIRQLKDAELYTKWQANPTGAAFQHDSLLKAITAQRLLLGPKDIDDLSRAMFYAGAAAAKEDERRYVRAWLIFGNVMLGFIVLLTVIQLLNGTFDWRFGWSEAILLGIIGGLFRREIANGFRSARRKVTERRNNSAEVSAS